MNMPPTKRTADDVQSVLTVDQLRSWVCDYIALIEKLSKLGWFGDIVIYPAIGVDALVAMSIPVVGINHWNHDVSSIVSQLSPILPFEVMDRFTKALSNNLTYIHHLDVLRLDLFQDAIKASGARSRKSLFIKGLFHSVFENEWDPDSERYYRLPLDKASGQAREWLAEVVNRLNPGDSIVVCDPALIDCVSSLPRVRDAWRFYPESGTDLAPVYSRGGVPILVLARFVQVFQRI